MGYEIHVIPTWYEMPSNPWPARLEAAGCKIVQASAESLASVQGLRGATVVAFCNSAIGRVWRTLKSLDCKLVWIPCMNHTMRHEHEVFGDYPPSAVVFQSCFQHNQLRTQYTLWRVPDERQYLIHGYLEPSLHPFKPKQREGVFVVGKLARNTPMPHAAAKWPASLWPILKVVRSRGVKIGARCMAWSPDVEKKCGAPPVWAECFPQEAVSTDYFLSGCDALLCSGDCEENWSRVALEAMASGVPVVADHRGGFTEMIQHGVDGMLCKTPDQFVEALTTLATDEDYRQAMLYNARVSLESLSDVEEIGEKWRELFSSLN